MNKLLLLILGMMAVTYVPRLLPFIMISTEKLPTKMRRFLKFVPYTALGAMIMPGVFTSVPKMPQAAFLGITFALIYSWMRGGIIVSVFGAIFVCFMTLMLRS